MFEKLREMVGADPIQQDDGSFTPSKLALKLAAPSKTDYDDASYPDALPAGSKKVLVICTEEQDLITENGERFRTGNHPVETFVVLLHLEKAGFGFDFATISGNPVPIEEWAMPDEDQAVIDIRQRYQADLDNPMALSTVIADRLGDTSPYAAIYIPGGHGAVLGLPQSLAVKEALLWALGADKHIISICHGPSAFLSMTIDEDPESFPCGATSIRPFPIAATRCCPRSAICPARCHGISAKSWTSWG